ncbi:MAG: HAMP domain-containing protein, partial [Rhodospirillaceae bacterium]|nr:HAMP domain-containing protein [Rhodospirillaceae bacterium]
MFNNVKIKMKIIMGFSVVLAILAIVSGIAYFDFGKVGSGMRTYAEVVNGATGAAEVESKFLTMVKHAREFANSGHEEDAKIVHELSSELISEVMAIAEKEENPKHKALLEGISANIEDYITKFKEAENLSHEFNSMIIDRMEPEGIKVLEDLGTMQKDMVKSGNTDASTYIGNAREHALLTRLYANILIGRQDDSFGDKAKNELAALHSVLQSLGKSLHSENDKKIFKEIEELVTDYEKTVDAIHEEEIKMNELINKEMAADTKKLLEDVSFILADSHEEEMAIEKETLAITSDAESMMMIIAIIGFVSGGVISLAVGQAISSPIVMMTDSMTVLADGNLEAEIPAQGRGDEIGEMSHAVQVFKENAIEVKRLEAEQKAAEERQAKERRDLMLKMASDFEGSVGGVVNSVSSAATEMQSSATALSATAEQTSNQATTVAAASEEAATNVQTVAN